MPVMYYERIFKAFQRFKVKYLIAGGIAMNLYGVPRFTKDLDILVETTPRNLGSLKRAIVALRFRPRMPVTLDEFLKPSNWQKWKHEKGCLALNLYNPKDPYEGIDILNLEKFGYESSYPKHTTIHAGALKLHLVSLDILIKMKKDANRAQDLSDLEALKTVKNLQKAKYKK